MAERHLIVDNLKFSYEGLFNSSELYTVLSNWFYDKGWDWYEKMNEEIIDESGKHLHMVLEPWKSSSDYYKLIIRITLNFIDMKTVEVKHDKETLSLNKGVIRMSMNGYVLSDRNKLWDEKPFYWFLSFILERYFFRNHFGKFETWLKSDVEDIHNHIKGYLNSFKYTYQH